MRRISLMLLCLLGLPLAGYAQGVTTAALTGTVTDERGEPLPGANVVAVHEPTGTQYGTTTQIDGRYALLNLLPGGPYTVTVSFVGYQTRRETDLMLPLGQTRVLDFTLAEATVELQALEVVGVRSSVLNSDRTGARTNIDETTIERVPTITRSLADFTRLTPQATGGFSLAGRNNRYNNIQIDGATLNDVFGLSGTGMPGGQADAQPISLDAIQEFNIDIAPFDVRYNGFTGGSINAVTKSGTNRLSGSVRYLGRNQNFVGDLKTPDGETVPFGDFSEYTLVGNLGGPIQPNRAFFFVNAEYQRRKTPLDVGVQGSRAATIFPVALDSLNRIIEIARTRYGYDPGGFDPLSNATDNFKLLAKIDWNLAPNHRLTLRHNYVNADKDEGISRGTFSFDLSNRRWIFESVQNSTVLELKSTFGTNLFNEARLVYTRIRDKRTVKAQPFPQVSILVNDRYTVNLGIDRFSQANALDQDLWEFTDNLTYFRGKHTITVGTSNQIYRFSNLFIQDYYGAYEFDSIADFEAGRPSRYFFSYSLLDDPQPRAEFTAYQLGFYVQDQYQATPHLSVTVGLRVDVPLYPDKPLYNPAVPEAFPGYSTATTASGNPLWSPRLGFNWDLSKGARTTQLRGGTGIFSGRTPFVWISNQYSNTGVDFGRVDARNLPEGCFVPEPDPAAQPRPGTPLGTTCGLAPITTTEVNLIDEDFKFPQVWRTDLALDQQLPYGLIGTIEFLYSKTINDVVFENLNIVRTGTAQGGRVLYGTPSFNGSTARKDPRFTNAILLKNTDKGYSTSLTVGLQREARAEGLSGALFYTWNRAENVNNATSSRAISNWQYNEARDVNNPELGTADFEVRHRILAHLSYRVRYQQRFATTVTLIYEGRSGSPFTWIYNGNANADTRRDNDPIYVPASPDEIVFAPDSPGGWDELNAFIESEPSLRKYRGQIVPRNSARAPWRNLLDLQVLQEIQTLGTQRLEITATLLNVLNLLNSDWGKVRYTLFDTVRLMDFQGYDDQGRAIVRFTPVQDRDDLFITDDLASRWQLQLGVRYVF
ncbi:TonB-dependent outer membrane receptor precursor [Rhodothermus marinus SG0.5JP17-172]|mgnify:FL=1|uniref:TonB-dependent receptor n=1 Tax=Rhodothermus marinus TaxID=29549 RepID=UPI000223D6B2|nr:carboxypeptidase regulatory-like domain-containing protein [Rhodothermus marinus]AEN72259.1 TonB-dependent outer membrane receptor precursor [Rhodothermus marinus SG0.5JP17-172]